MREQPQNEQTVLKNTGKSLWDSGYQMLTVQRPSYCAIRRRLKYQEIY